MADAAVREAGGPTPGIKFRGVAYGKLETIPHPDNIQVYLEPTAKDKAHANLVIINAEKPEYLQDIAAPKPAHEPYRSISAWLAFCDAPDLTPLEALRP